MNRKLALPILAAAADENSDELLDLWARLLAAAKNPDQSKQGRLGFINALKRLDPLDPRALVWMHTHAGSTNTEKQNKLAEEFGVSRDEVDVSVANLMKANFAGPPGANLFTGQSPMSAALEAVDAFRPRVSSHRLRLTLVGWPCARRDGRHPI